MNLFDQLVTEALHTSPDNASLRMVVEKELLHHDILREMSHAGLLEKLTFIGGTCLRACYGSRRLSEDLDFTGGSDFSSDQLSGLGAVLKDRLLVKYGLPVEVSEPTRDAGNVATWKMKIITRPDQRTMPTQRVHIDICAVPSYDRRPAMLRNYYGIDMGTSGLILQAQSREEILADKFIALAFRPNRIKNRDLWDIVWLKQQGVALPLELVLLKIADHQHNREDFLHLLNERQQLVAVDQELNASFVHEMQRFLPIDIVSQTVENKDFWPYLTGVVSAECRLITRFLKGDTESALFKM